MEDGLTCDDVLDLALLREEGADVVGLVLSGAPAKTA